MSEEIKLCPFCAEEIKSAAIVCKHCGRELPGYEEEVKSLQPKKEGEKESPEVVEIGETQAKEKVIIPKKSIWKAARPFAIFMAALTFLVGLIYRVPFIAYLGAEGLPLVMTLIIPVAINFFGFWAVGALIVWIWRNVGFWGLVGLVLCVGIITTLLFFSGSDKELSLMSFSQTNTHTKIPTKEPTIIIKTTIPPNKSGDIGACDCPPISKEMIENISAGSRLCVSAIIKNLPDCITWSSPENPICILIIYWNNYYSGIRMNANKCNRCYEDDTPLVPGTPIDIYGYLSDFGFYSSEGDIVVDSQGQIRICSTSK